MSGSTILEAQSRREEIDWSNPTGTVNSGLMYEFFARYHEPAAEADLSVEQIDRAQNFTDTAVLVLGRDSGGEECDRHFRGDYGLIDLSWSLRYPAVKSILFMGIPGQEGAAALADILICAGGSYSPAPGTDCGVEDGSAFL